MHNRLAIASVDSPLGELGLVAGEHGLLTVALGKPLDKYLPKLLKRRDCGGRARHDPSQLIEQACNEIVEYLLSAREKFDTPLDLSMGTEFQRVVWRRLRRIKFGKTTSYASLAENVGKPNGARAVGNAVGTNPLPIFIPCHRVLASDDKLGGFSGGLGRKRKLLRIEGAKWR